MAKITNIQQLQSKKGESKISPSDFVYLYNQVLSRTLKIGEVAAWPLTIIRFPTSEPVNNWVDFVIKRINKDEEFRTEVKFVTSYDIEFFVERNVDVVMVKAKLSQNL